MRRTTWGVVGMISFVAACSSRESTGADGGSTTDAGDHAGGGATGSGGATSTDGGGDAMSTDGGEDADPTTVAPIAALTFVTNAAPGFQCTTTTAQLSVPAAASSNVLQELNCDISVGCKPDQYVVTNRSAGADLYCSVSPMGDSFAVSASLNAAASNGAPSISFSATGVLTPTGGTLSISQTNTVAGGGSQTDCTVTIAPPRGVINRGAIWATFDCPRFRDPSPPARAAGSRRTAPSSAGRGRATARTRHASQLAPRAWSTAIRHRRWTSPHARTTALRKK